MVGRLERATYTSKQHDIIRLITFSRCCKAVIYFENEIHYIGTRTLADTKTRLYVVSTVPMQQNRHD